VEFDSAKFNKIGKPEVPPMTFPRHMSPRLSMKADPALPGSDLYPQSKGDPGKIIFDYVTLFRKRQRKY